MTDRQSGAAHINIFFFLIMLVLFLGAVVFAYVKVEENTKLKEDIATAQDAKRQSGYELQVYKHYVEDISKPVGETGTYRGRDGWNYDIGSADGMKNTDPAFEKYFLEGVSLPERVKEKVNAFAGSVGVAPGGVLADALNAAVSKVQSLQEQVTTLETERGNLQNTISELQKANRDAVSTHSRAISAREDELAQKNEDYSASEEQLRGTIRQQNQEYRTLNEQMSEQTAEHQTQVAGLRKEIETLQARIDAAADKVRLLNPGNAPDGMVLESSQATGLAWINLGRRDMLPIGTEFEIVRANTDAVKGYATVIGLEQTRAQVRVTGLKDRFDPIMPGDQVRNDLYSPGMRHNIYLMGRFSHPYSRPLVKQLLEELGNNVAEDLSPAVDLVLIGGDSINDEKSGFTPVTETPEYERARFLRIEMAPLNKVRRFLKLGDSPR